MSEFRRISPLLIIFVLLFSVLAAQNPAKGFKLMDKEDYDKAEETFNSILEKEPENAGALFGMSLLQLKMKKGDTHSNLALSYLEKAEAAYEGLEDKDKEKMTEYGASPAEMESHRDKLEYIFYTRAKESQKLEEMQGFVDKFPESKIIDDAIVIRNELAYKRVWERVAEEGLSVGLFEDFVKNYPKAEQVVQAEFEIAKIKNTPEAFEAFIDKYPISEFVGEAKEAAHQAAFDQAKKENTEAAFVTFIRKYPTANQYNKAVQLRDAAAFEEAKNASPTQRVQALTDFLSKYPNASQAAEAKKTRDELAFQQASMEHTIEAYRNYLTKFPGTAQGVEASFRIADLYHTPGALQTFVENNPGSQYEKLAETSINALANPKEQFDVSLGAFPANDPHIYISKGSYHIFAHNPDAPDYVNHAFQLTKAGDKLQSANIKTRAYDEGYMFDTDFAHYADRPDGRGNLNQLYLVRQFKSNFDKEVGQLEMPYYLKVNYYELFKPMKSNAELAQKFKISRARAEYRFNGTPAYHTPKSNKQGVRHLELDTKTFIEAGMIDGKDLGMIPYTKLFTETDSGWFDESKGLQVVSVRPGATEVSVKNLIRLDDSHVLIHFRDEAAPDNTVMKPITGSAIRSGYKHNATGSELASNKKMFVMDKAFYGLDRTKQIAGRIGAGEELYFLPEYMTCANSSKFVTHTLVVYHAKTQKVVSKATLYGDGLTAFADGAGGYYAVYGQGPALLSFDQGSNLNYVNAPEKCASGTHTPYFTSAGRYLYLGGSTTPDGGTKVPVIRIYEKATGNFIRDDKFPERGDGTAITGLTSEGISILFLTGGDGKVSFHKRKY